MLPGNLSVLDDCHEVFFGRKRCRHILFSQAQNLGQHSELEQRGEDFALPVLDSK